MSFPIQIGDLPWLSRRLSEGICYTYRLVYIIYTNILDNKAILYLIMVLRINIAGFTIETEAEYRYSMYMIR